MSITSLSKVRNTSHSADMSMISLSNVRNTLVRLSINSLSKISKTPGRTMILPKGRKVRYMSSPIKKISATTDRDIYLI